MADCTIKNAALEDAVKSINEIKNKYKTEGETFVTAFHNAIAEMQGESKDALLEMFDKNYKDFVQSEEAGLSGMIGGLASLLEGNRSNFETVDAKIAASIRGEDA